MPLLPEGLLVDSSVALTYTEQYACRRQTMVISFLAITFLLFILGAIVGSFLSVVIYRTVNEENWIWGRSHCDQCLVPVKWYDNIPIVSFLVLRARCRSCQEPIPLSYPVVEFLTGTLFVWWYWGGFFFFELTKAPFQMLQPLFWLTVGVLLLLIAVADALYYIIPDIAVVLLTLVSVAYRLFLVSSGVMQLNDFLYTLVAMVGVVSFFGTLWTITRGKGMGLGDVKLVAPLALLLGWPKILVAIFLAFILGATVGIMLLAIGRKKTNHVIPFGPFLVAGTCISLVAGGELINWYLSLLVL